MLSGLVRVRSDICLLLCPNAGVFRQCSDPDFFTNGKHQVLPPAVSVPEGQVRQQNHQKIIINLDIGFATISRAFLSPTLCRCPNARCRVLRGGHVYWMLINTCDPTLRPIHVFRLPSHWCPTRPAGWRYDDFDIVLTYIGHCFARFHQHKHRGAASRRGLCPAARCFVC